jgi:hypothetical protein
LNSAEFNQRNPEWLLNDGKSIAWNTLLLRDEDIIRKIAWVNVLINQHCFHNGNKYELCVPIDEQ